MRLRITIEGVSYDVEVEVLDEGAGGAAPRPVPATPSPQGASRPAPPASSAPSPPGAEQAAPPTPATDENVCRSPIAGTVLEIKVQPGDQVTLNQVLMVVEAMKMETNIAAPVAGTVKAVHVEVGEAVKPGQILVEFE
jgi:biotin carboxyl carrier protein